MIPWCRILLLVTGLMFLINNDESQALEWEKDSTAGSQDNVVGIARQLLLPYLHALGITVFRMINTQPVAKYSLQALHHLYGKCNFRHEIKHLSMLFQFALDEMDKYFRLTTRCHAMQERDTLLHKRKEYLIIGFLLGRVQCLNLLRMWLTAMIQPPHFNFIGLQQASLDQLVDNRKRCLCGIHQFFAGNFHYRLTA